MTLVKIIDDVDDVTATATTTGSRLLDVIYIRVCCVRQVDLPSSS